MFTRLSEFDKLFGNANLLRDRLNKLYSNFDRPYGSGLQWARGESLSKTNMYEDENHFEIRTEVPGLDKEKLNVKIQGNYLEISGKRDIDVPEGYKTHKTERESTSFSRSFTLPAEVDAAKVDATLKNGILYLTLPKSEAAKPKKITVG